MSNNILSPVLLTWRFPRVTDPMSQSTTMETVTQGRRHGIRLTQITVLQDVDYADDIGLLTSKQQDAQRKAERLSITANTIVLKFNIQKTKVMRKNIRVNDSIMIDGEHLEDVEELTYLGTKSTNTGDCNEDINTRIRNVDQAFAMMKPVWRATNLSVHTKIKIF